VGPWIRGLGSTAKRRGEAATSWFHGVHGAAAAVSWFGGRHALSRGGGVLVPIFHFSKRVSLPGA